MKTVFELQFEKLIVSSISKKICAQKRFELFFEFHQSGSVYYEELCDALYLLSSGESKGSLYISPAGRSYISRAKECVDDRFMFQGEDLPRFNGDLQEQLNYFYRAFQKPRNVLPFFKSDVDFGITM